MTPRGGGDPGRSTSSLTAQSATVGLGLMFSRGLGFLRDIVIAARFGASRETDAYLVSAQVPIVFDALLAGNGLYSAMLPSATAAALSDDPNGKLAALVKNATTFVLLVSGSVSLLGAFFASQLVSMFGGGLAPQSHTVASRLTMLTILSLPFISLTNVMWVALNTRGKFWGPAIALSFSNLAIMACALTLGPSIGIYALGVGLVAGSILQVGSQFFQLWRDGVPIRLGIDFKNPEFIGVLTNLWPLALSGVIAVLSPAVDNFVATFLPSGGVTVIRYAQGLTIPFSLLGVAISIAVLPRLSRAVATKDSDGIVNLLHRIVRFLGLTLFGAAAVLIVIRVPLVALAYHRGAFDSLAAHRTVEALAMYALAIPFASTYYFLLRALLAYMRIRELIAINAAMLVLNLVLDLAFLPSLAHAGIALSSVCVQATYVLLAVLVLRRDLKVKRIGRTLLAPLAVNGAAAGLALWLSYGARGLLAGVFPNWNGGSLLAVQLAVLIPAYIGLSRLAGYCELDWIRRSWSELIRSLPGKESGGVAGA